MQNKAEDVARVQIKLSRLIMYMRQGYTGV